MPFLLVARRRGRRPLRANLTFTRYEAGLFHRKNQKAEGSVQNDAAGVFAGVLAGIAVIRVVRIVAAILGPAVLSALIAVPAHFCGHDGSVCDDVQLIRGNCQPKGRAAGDDRHPVKLCCRKNLPGSIGKPYPSPGSCDKIQKIAGSACRFDPAREVYA